MILLSIAIVVGSLCLANGIYHVGEGLYNIGDGIRHYVEFRENKHYLDKK